MALDAVLTSLNSILQNQVILLQLGINGLSAFREMTLGEVQGACWHRTMCCDLHFCVFFHQARKEG